MLDFQKAWVDYVALCRAQSLPIGDIVAFRSGFDSARDQMVLGDTNNVRLAGTPCKDCGRVECGEECPSVEWRPEKDDWGGKWEENPDSPYPVYKSSREMMYHKC